jgi:SMI1 / KNR4 family (SUKH-1)
MVYFCLTQIILSLTFGGGGFSVMSNYFLPPANEEQIQQCESLLKKILPQSYKNFLLLCNGAVLAINDSEHDALGRGLVKDKWENSDAALIIMGTNNLVSFNNNVREFYHESTKDYQEFESLIAFCYDGAAMNGECYAFDLSLHNKDNEFPILKIFPTMSILDCRECAREEDSFHKWLIPILLEVKDDDPFRLTVLESYLL